LSAGKDVLVVDDSVVMKDLISDMLGRDGFNVVGHARDGEEAVELYEELGPDLVTMDIVMPKVHGIASLKMILGRNPQARIVVVSALNQQALVMEALDAGARNFVVKPFTEKELLEAVRKSLG
jgi:two-component system chemotaxis response regulator CheY